jgi:hypothetical protein
MQNVSKKDKAHQKWLMFSKFWSCYNESKNGDKANIIHFNHAFVNHSEEDEIYPLTVKEIAEALRADAQLKHLFKHNAVFDKGQEL